MSRLIEAFKGPRKGAPPVIKEFLKQYGNYNIIDIKVCRTPIFKQISTIGNFITFGQLNKKLKEKNYDDLFHLFMVLTIQKESNILLVRIEKNQIIQFSILSEHINRSDTTCKDVSFKKKQRTLIQFINYGADYQFKSLKSNYWLYSAKNNNCQIFVLANIYGNDLICKDCNDQKELLDFVKQNTEDLLAGPLWSLTQGITDLAATVDVILHGGSINFGSGINSNIQSVIVPKEWGLKKAKQWIKQHGYMLEYYGKKAQLEGNFYRFRQAEPLSNDIVNYYTKKLPNGVELILMYNN